MKKNIATLLGIAFVVAVIATGVFYGLVAGKVRSASADEPKVGVVVASRALARGATLDRKDLQVVMYQQSTAPKGTVPSVDQAAGLSLVEAIGENQPVLETQVVSHNTIPAGMRVVSIRATDSSGVVALLRPGYRIDLQVVAGNSAADTGLKTIVQNIAVLSLSAPDNGKPVVNLLVTPDEADLIGLADSTARVRLVLRNPGDAARSAANMVPSEKLLQGNSRQNVTSRP